MTARQRIAGLVVAAVLTAASTILAAPVPDPASRPPLVLEAIEVEGNPTTPDGVVLEYLDLAPGQTIDQDRLVDAVDDLRRSHLFDVVEFHTRPGSARGRLVLVLEVHERRADLRIGTGNNDLDGWYLVPAQLEGPVGLGWGEDLDVQLRVGYRHSGLIARFGQPRCGDGRNSWGVELAALATDRIWFLDATEYRQRVDVGTAEFHVGRRLTRHLSLEAGVRREKVEVDSTAFVHRDNDVAGRSEGDELPYGELPASIRTAVGEHERSVVRLDLVVDSRGRARPLGVPSRGLWGRLRGEYYGPRDADSFGAATLDLRGYVPLWGGSLAARARGSVLSDPDGIAFFDRLYLGGEYTVRGVPSHSLSRPQGETSLWTASLEYRAPLSGSPDRPRLAGLLFLDAGGTPDEQAASFGWGVRLRVAWLGWLGLDVGIPLTDPPVDEAFHVNATLGWSF